MVQLDDGHGAAINREGESESVIKNFCLGEILPPADETGVDENTPVQKKPLSSLEDYRELARGVLSKDEFNAFSNAVDQYYALHLTGQHILSDSRLGLLHTLEYGEKYQEMSDEEKIKCVWSYCLKDIINEGVSSDPFKDFRKELECRLDSPTWYSVRNIGLEERILSNYNLIFNEKSFFGLIRSSSDKNLGDLWKACNMIGQDKYRQAYEIVEELFKQADQDGDELAIRICLHLQSKIVHESNAYLISVKMGRKEGLEHTVFSSESQYRDYKDSYYRRCEKYHQKPFLPFIDND